jgi:CheY-like chemotaxis protein
MRNRQETRFRVDSSPGRATASDRGAEKTHVLIVEDDASSRRAMTNVLEDCGYTVASVGTASDALDWLRHKSLPRLIVLDLMLPDMEGWDFRHQQKQNPALAAIPVIGVSAIGKLVDVKYSFRKPLDYDEFLSAVEECLGRPSDANARRTT